MGVAKKSRFHPSEIEKCEVSDGGPTGGHLNPNSGAGCRQAGPAAARRGSATWKFGSNGPCLRARYNSFHDVIA